ncbi:MAG: ABC-type transport auxiliary lipoprotein family protein, partial [Pseudomonadota bacterium]|nr:ABC-type transport auxiliary lipoprotein family protein [Pseudomonadota bacterium]
PDTHYDLDVTMAPVSFGAEAAIALRRVDVRGLQSGRSLVLVTGTDPVRFQEQRGHFWHVATPTLIERAFLTAMNEASTDAAFGTSDSFDKVDYRLILSVSRFAYVAGGEAMVDFDATVTSADGDVVLARSYWGRAPLAGEAPADGVNGLGVALGEAMTVFAAELATALPPATN